jgi:quinol monooxygenase YgiN
MTKGVQFVVDITVNDGKLEAFEALTQEMIAGSREEAGTLGYDFYLSGDRKHCRLVEKYVDGDAALGHMKGPVVEELVPKLLEVSCVTGFEVYGDPGQKVSEIVAGFGAQIFPLWHALKG